MGYLFFAAVNRLDPVYTAAASHGLLAAGADVWLLCMSLYYRSGSIVCSMFDLPTNALPLDQITAAARCPVCACRLSQDRQPIDVPIPCDS